MATSGWQWNAINRNRDYSFVGDTEFYRENWQLTRWRYSDAAWSTLGADGALGDTSTSLSATNGGVTETVTPPSYNALECINISTYEQNSEFSVYENDYKFYKTAWTWTGMPAYVSTKSCAPSAFHNTAIKGDHTPAIISEDGGVNWFIIAEPTGNLTSGVLDFNSYSGYDGSAFAITSEWVATVSGLPSRTGVVAEVSTTADFRCTSDLQTYDTSSVNWFKQTQTWVSRSPWL